MENVVLEDVNANLGDIDSYGTLKELTTFLEKTLCSL
jgi:hypothetical protein